MKALRGLPGAPWRGHHIKALRGLPGGPLGGLHVKALGKLPVTLLLQGLDVINPLEGLPRGLHLKALGKPPGVCHEGRPPEGKGGLPVGAPALHLPFRDIEVERTATQGPSVPSQVNGDDLEKYSPLLSLVRRKLLRLWCGFSAHCLDGALHQRNPQRI